MMLGESTRTEDGRYERLNAFDFRGNEKFMKGWKSVCKTADQSNISGVLMKAQVFFYSRDQEKVDLHKYKTWLKEQNKAEPRPELFADVDDVQPELDSQSSGTRQANNDNPSEDSEQTGSDRGDNPVNSDEPTGTKGETKCNSETSENELTEKYPANFSELVEMLQKGMKLPGIDDINIEPTNEEPTLPVLERKKKPWES